MTNGNVVGSSRRLRRDRRPWSAAFRRIKRRANFNLFHVFLCAERILFAAAAVTPFQHVPSPAEDRDWQDAEEHILITDADGEWPSSGKLVQAQQFQRPDKGMGA